MRKNTLIWRQLAAHLGNVFPLMENINVYFSLFWIISNSAHIAKMFYITKEWWERTKNQFLPSKTSSGIFLIQKLIEIQLFHFIQSANNIKLILWLWMHKLCANICSSPRHSVANLIGYYFRVRTEGEIGKIWNKIYEFLIKDKFSLSLQMGSNKYS